MTLKSYMANTKFQAEKRRTQVAKIYFEERVSQTEVAKRLGVANSTIYKDIKIIEKRWLEQNTDYVERARIRDLKQCDWGIRQCIDRLDRLKTDPRAGSRWMEELRKWMEYRGKVLGLYAAKKYEVKKAVLYLNKENKDAAIRAAVKQLKPNNDITKIEFDDTGSVDGQLHPIAKHIIGKTEP